MPAPPTPASRSTCAIGSYSSREPRLVIAGGVSGAGEILLAPLQRQLANMARLPPRLELSTLGARVVVLGAIRHALDAIEPALLDGLLEAA